MIVDERSNESSDLGGWVIQAKGVFTALEYERRSYELRELRNSR